MQDKKALVITYIFLLLLIFYEIEYKLEQRTAYTSVIKDSVAKVLLYQFIKKAFRFNIYNFWILYILWDLNLDRITFIVVQAIRLQYHLQKWKYEKKIFLKKPHKRNRTLIKSYQVISPLNCLGKIVEKVEAEQLLQFCKANKKLYKQ